MRTIGREQRRWIVAAAALVLVVAAAVAFAVGGDDADDRTTDPAPSTATSAPGTPVPTDAPVTAPRQTAATSPSTDAATSVPTRSDSSPTEPVSPPATGSTAGGNGPAPTPAPTSPPAAPAEPPSEDEIIEVIETLDQVVLENLAVLPTTTDPTGSVAGTGATELGEVAVGAMLSELEATLAEFEDMGWTQVGTPSVTSVELLSGGQPGDTEATVAVCIDSSNVRVADQSGNDMRNPDAPSRSLHIYVLVWLEGRWLASEHTFPDDPTC